ncbi:hypothetical protein GCM10023238_02410 [Streptomyces heliomycini]
MRESSTLDEEGFKRINPNTRTAPICESSQHLRLLEEVHERVPLLRRYVSGGLCGPLEVGGNALHAHV